MYTNQFPRRAVAEVAGLQVEQVFLSPPAVSEGAGFTLALPDGLDWADYEEQEEGPPIRTPRPVWDWYRQQYPQLGPEPPTPEEVAAWAPPASEPAPVTDVEKYKEVFVGARQNATLLIDSIKAAVQDALVKGNVYSPSEATIQGVEFVFHHSVSIAAYKEAGGHPAAAAKLLSVFKSEPSVNAFRWVPSVAAIFEQALTY